MKEKFIKFIPIRLEKKISFLTISFHFFLFVHKKKFKKKSIFPNFFHSFLIISISFHSLSFFSNLKNKCLINMATNNGVHLGPVHPPPTNNVLPRPNKFIVVHWIWIQSIITEIEIIIITIKYFFWKCL